MARNVKWSWTWGTAGTENRTWVPPGHLLSLSLSLGLISQCLCPLPSFSKQAGLPHIGQHKTPGVWWDPGLQTLPLTETLVSRSRLKKRNSREDADWPVRVMCPSGVFMKLLVTLRFYLQEIVLWSLLLVETSCFQCMMAPVFIELLIIFINLAVVNNHFLRGI